MGFKRDLTGLRFGKLFVIGFSGNKGPKKEAYWDVTCDCGVKKAIRGSLLTRSNGPSTSCGCVKAKKLGDFARKHGKSHTRLYYIWQSMKQRCQDSRNKRYHDYGGRGITVCSEWQTYEGFAKDMGSSWIDGLSIERINNNKGYCKENCKWIPRSDQSKNRRSFKNARLIETNRGMMTILQASREFGIADNVIRSRLDIGWDVERAISTPVRSYRDVI